MGYKDKEKQREYDRKWQATKRQKPGYVNAARIKRLEWVKEQKDNKPCTDCDVRYPYYVMDFDHIGTDKVAGISRLKHISNMEALAVEIAKCELVCANCHRQRTHERLALVTQKQSATPTR